MARRMEQSRLTGQTEPQLWQAEYFPAGTNFGFEFVPWISFFSFLKDHGISDFRFAFTNNIDLIIYIVSLFILSAIANFAATKLALYLKKAKKKNP